MTASAASGLGNVVLIAACLGLGYIVVHVVDRRVKQVNLLVASGLEYIVVGIVLAQTILPSQASVRALAHRVVLDIVLAQTALPSPDPVRALAPVITFGIGSVGLLVGLRTHRHRRPRIEAEAARSAAWSSSLAFVAVAAAYLVWYLAGARWLGAAFPGSPGDSASELLLPALVLGAAAAVSASEPILQVIRFTRPRVGFMSRLATNTAWLSEIVGIVLFGLGFCVVHLGSTDLPREPTIVEWFGINLGLGLVLGVIFALFLGRETNDERLLVAGLGIVVFASGVAYYLNLSPILVNFIVGVVLARLSSGPLLLERLKSVEKPGFIVLYIFLGFAWSPPPLYGWVLVGLYVIARYGGKLMASYLTYYYSEEQERYAHGFGMSLSAQGGLVAAMALNYDQVYSTPLNAVIVNTLVVSLLVNELVGRRATRNMLLNANELTLQAAAMEHDGPLPEEAIDWDADNEPQPKRTSRRGRKAQKSVVEQGGPPASPAMETAAAGTGATASPWAGSTSAPTDPEVTVSAKDESAEPGAVDGDGDTEGRR